MPPCCKLHLAIDASGKLIEMFLSGGQVHDSKCASSLVSDIIGCYVIADKGYDSKRFRQELENGNNVAVIPPRSLWKRPVNYDKKLYKRRGLIERVIGGIKENKRIAMRFDKEDLTFLSFVCLAFVKYYL